jgi:hypothetical protein
MTDLQTVLRIVKQLEKSMEQKGPEGSDELKNLILQSIVSIAC